MKRENGITLVALVITVIIILILAGVALSLITGEDGLFARANHSAQKYGDMSQVEADKVGGITSELNKYSGVLPETPELPELSKTETEFTQKANGVIDIVWLDTNNNVIDEPLSPKDHLGELTAVKHNGSAWESVDANSGSNDWYKYEAQTGNTNAGGTSKWANAKIEKDGKTAYFVWIPRYAYKITYFDTADNAEAYRTSGSETGIIGYSTIQGIIDAKGDEAKVVEGTEPTNVKERVMSTEYADYIPHPAFEFNGHEAGIWVGKYEASGSTTEIEIKENASSLRGVTVDTIFTVSKEIKSTYGLSGDTHMMKNTEWGAVAYLTESKYGRNGTEVTKNTDENYTTGGKDGNITENKLQSSTGNEYGIYDLSGGAFECVAGYVDNDDVKNNGYNGSLIRADIKYKDVYAVGATDDIGNNYQENKGVKGDAVYETSTLHTGSTSWHGDCSYFPHTNLPIFERGGIRHSSGTNAGVFHFDNSSGDASIESYGNNGGFRVVLI